jgi:hypothetical protein
MMLLWVDNAKVHWLKLNIKQAQPKSAWNTMINASPGA